MRVNWYSFNFPKSFWKELAKSGTTDHLVMLYRNIGSTKEKVQKSTNYKKITQSRIFLILFLACAGCMEVSASQLSQCGTMRAWWRSSSSSATPTTTTTTTSSTPTMCTLEGRLPHYNSFRRQDLVHPEGDQRKNKGGGRKRNRGEGRRRSRGKENKQRDKKGRRRGDCSCKRLGRPRRCRPPPPPHPPPRPFSSTPQTPRLTFLSSWITDLWLRISVAFVIYSKNLSVYKF